MGRVTRLVYALAAAVAVLTLAPLTGSAASPTPSPSLDSVLAQPPSADYTTLTTSTFHGEFTAHDWAAVSTGAPASETESTLNRYGFVDGYGKTWSSTSARRGLIEIVMAFTGGQGARKTLTALERSDKSDPSYKHSDSISGIDPYYGGHYMYAASNSIGDVFSFVKGNDLFIVGFVSAQDDALALATTQTKTQYDSAPSSTIPSSQWPENASSNSSFSPTSLFLPVGFIVAVVVALVGFIVRSRRRASTPPYGAVAPAVSGQLSPDGNYWWDGQAWRDASTEAPPLAQRSSDGNLWWDGRNWRPVPQPAPAQQPPTA
jgi:hypothetical protein